MATEALRDRSIGMYPDADKNRQAVIERKVRMARRRQSRTHLANKLYNQWLAAGCPSIAQFARQIEWPQKPDKLRDLFWKAERKMPWAQRRLDTFYGSYRKLKNSRYLTNAEKGGLDERT